jgi:EmrB/QacA subfamily drug resistance transporter
MLASAVQQPCDDNVIRAAPSADSCSKSRGRWILAATILGSSMAFIDGTVVNVALPVLQTSLDASAADVQWVVEAYSLFLSALLLVGGSLGDHYGRRRIFLLGVALFAIASAACGLAADIRQLIMARAIQGVGAALLVPGSLALLSSAFAEKDRGPAIGTWSGFSAITSGMGPVLGGWLIERVSWRAAFLINIPVAFAVIIISIRHVPESHDRRRRRIDWLGAMFAASALGALVYGLIESTIIGFGHWSVIAALIAFVPLIVLFAVVERNVSDPMLPLELFRSHTFAGANLLTFLLYAALGGTLFFLPLNLIQVQRYSATAAGAALLPFILIISALSRWAGAAPTRFGAKLPLIIGPLIASSGFALFARPGVGGTYWSTFFPAIVVLGVGMAVSVAPLTTAVMNSVPTNRVGAASGINNTVARSAGLVAIAVLGIVMFQIFNRSLDHRIVQLHLPRSATEYIGAQRTKLAAIALPPEQDAKTQQLSRQAIDESFVSGFRAIMAIGAAMAAAGSAISLIFIGQASGEVVVREGS